MDSTRDLCCLSALADGSPMRFQPKPTHERNITAIQWKGKNEDELRALVTDPESIRFDANGILFVGTYKAFKVVHRGEWVTVRDDGLVSALTSTQLDARYDLIGDSE